MPELPEEVCKAWDNRNGPIVLVTVNEAGLPKRSGQDAVGMRLKQEGLSGRNIVG